MLLAPSVAALFKWRQFEPEMILLAVGWYLRFPLSYRDVEELLAERGLHADHVTVWRWVQRYGPEIQRRLRPRLRPTNDCWRVDETYIRVKGKWVYSYGRSTPRIDGVDHKMALRALFAAIRWVLARFLAPRVHRIETAELTEEQTRSLLSKIRICKRCYGTTSAEI
jgi:hypothetical protein